MKKLKILGLVVLFALVGLFLFSCVLICLNPYNTHNVLLKEEVNKLYNTQEFMLNDVVPFEWDEMYVIEKGVSSEEVKGIINVHHSLVKDSFSGEEENTACVIFLKDGVITAYLNGYVSDIGFDVKIPMNKGNYGVLHSEDNPVFYIENVNGVPVLCELNYAIRGGIDDV